MFNADTQMLILNSIRQGNFRNTAARAAGINPKTLSKWMHRTEPKYVEFAQLVIEAEANIESKCVNKLIEAGDKDAKWYAWWLERKCKHWNISVHRWEFSIVQKQLKQLRTFIDELFKDNPSAKPIDFQGYPAQEPAPISIEAS
jgi:hypothetical protein